MIVFGGEGLCRLDRHEPTVQQYFIHGPPMQIIPIQIHQIVHGFAGILSFNT